MFVVEIDVLLLAVITLVVFGLAAVMILRPDQRYRARGSASEADFEERATNKAGGRAPYTDYRDKNGWPS